MIMLLTQRSRIAWPILVLGWLLVACTSHLVYTGQPDRARLATLAGQRVALLRFDYQAEMLTTDTALAPAVAEPVLAFHKARLLDEMGAFFTLVDATDTPAADLPATLDALNARAGLYVTTVYGYRLSQSVAEQVAGQLAESLDPAGLTANLPFINDPTAVEFYYLAAQVRLVDGQGHTLWTFYGKASQLPQPLQGSPAEVIGSFLNLAAGLEPGQQELIRILGPMAQAYEAYQAWLFETELSAGEDTHYFESYPEAAKNLGIYPADDRQHVPFVVVDPQAAIATPAVADTWYRTLWITTQQADWRQWGQWPIAWAALKLFLLTFVVGTVLAGLYQWAGEKSCLGQLLVAPAVVASLAWLVSIWFLLKAIF